MKSASGLFKLLADGTRLRLLRVLAQDRFNVSELTGILGVAQSGVSRHLGLLTRISDWLWYFCPCDQSSRLDFRGFLERNQATEGDTQWVNYKPRPFSSRSTGF